MSSKNKFAASSKRYYRIDRREIAFVKFILEAYDGLAVVSTLDPQAGIVALHIAPGCEPDVEKLLEDLSRDIMMEPAQPPNED
jgi:hypothetical protein